MMLVLFMLGMLFYPAASAATAIPLIPCESLDGWGSGVELTKDAAEGKYAIKAKVAGKGVKTFYYRYPEPSETIAQAKAVSFLWRAEGAGLKSLLLKVRNYPIAGGMESVYKVWQSENDAAPTEWTRATVILSDHLYDNWGGEPRRNEAYLAFRTDNRLNGDVAVHIDDVVVLPKSFEFEVGDVAKDGGIWKLAVTLANVTASPLSVTLGRNDEPMEQVTLRKREQRLVEIPVQSPVGQVEQVWAEVTGVPESRLIRSTRLLDIQALPPHPRLLLSRQGLVELRARIDSQSWAASYWRQMMRRVDDIANLDVDIPQRGGNWWHWCGGSPDRPRSEKRETSGNSNGVEPDSHVIELVPGNTESPRNDSEGCEIARIHKQWASYVRDLALAYQVTGDSRYGAKAREILLAYAGRYESYPIRNARGLANTGGRVIPSAHGEAAWLIKMAEGADLVWGFLSPVDQETLELHLFRPAVDEVLRPARSSVRNIHNIQNWINSGIGVTGFLIGDKMYMRDAIADPTYGLLSQLEHGTTQDGVWYERSWGYHFYSLSAIVRLVEAANNSGVNLYTPLVKKMFDAPLLFASPSLVLPAFNDGGEVILTKQADIYELAFARYEEPNYGVVLDGSSRRNLWAFLSGANELPAPKRRHLVSGNYPETGLAVMVQSDSEEVVWLTLQYGEHGSGHGHPDKLSFVLEHSGVPITKDPGTVRYGRDDNVGWFRTSLAHNTLIVDEVSQSPATGMVRTFGSESGGYYAMFDAGDIYPGIRFLRTAVLLDNSSLIFIDVVSADQKRVLDIAFHPEAIPMLPHGGVAWQPPDKPGYRYLTDAVRYDLGGNQQLKLRFENNDEMRFVMLSEPRSALIAGWKEGEARARNAALILRQEAQHAVFIWGISLIGDMQLERLSVSCTESCEGGGASEGVAVVVQKPNNDEYSIAVNPGANDIWFRTPGGMSRRSNKLISVWKERVTPSP